MEFKVGPGTSGYNQQSEFVDFACSVVLGSGVTLQQGQAVWTDPTYVPGTVLASTASTTGNSTAVADKVLVAPSAVASGSWIYGIYQGASITAGTAVANYVYDIMVRRSGYGVVYAQVITAATGSAVIAVGSVLIAAANTAGLTGAYAGSAAIGTTVGIAMSTGSASALTNTILTAGVAATKVINAFIKA